MNTHFFVRFLVIYHNRVKECICGIIIDKECVRGSICGITMGDSSVLQEYLISSCLYL